MRGGALSVEHNQRGHSVPPCQQFYTFLSPVSKRGALRDINNNKGEQIASQMDEGEEKKTM